MALEITTIPVLTGDVAEKFEAQQPKHIRTCLNVKRIIRPDVQVMRKV